MGTSVVDQPCYCMGGLKCRWSRLTTRDHEAVVDHNLRSFEIKEFNYSKPPNLKWCFLWRVNAMSKHLKFLYLLEYHARSLGLTFAKCQRFSQNSMNHGLPQLPKSLGAHFQNLPRSSKELINKLEIRVTLGPHWGPIQKAPIHDDHIDFPGFWRHTHHLFGGVALETGLLNTVY